MTTFQAIIFGIIAGFSSFLPIAPNVHQRLMPYFLGWPELAGPALGAVALGTFLSSLVYFRHDWASIFSSLLQVILFRKKPMTLDERLPFFLLLTTLPAVVARFYLMDQASAFFQENMLIIAGVLAVYALILLFLDSWGRKNKGMFDWNWFDSLLIGLGAATAIVPGFGLLDGAVLFALFRNYNREATAKFSIYAITPLLGFLAHLHLRGISPKAGPPMPEMSWLSFALLILISFLCGLLAIGGLMKHLERGSFKQYGIYRLTLAAMIAGFAVWSKRGLG